MIVSDKDSLSTLWRMAMNANTPQEADEIFEALVGLFVKEMPRNRAEKEVRRQIGYNGGRMSNTSRAKIERLFKCEHPYFGKMAEMGPPSPEEAYMCSYKKMTLKQLRETPIIERNMELVPPHICPYCGSNNDAEIVATDPGSKISSKAGDISICIYCCNVGVINEDQTVSKIENHINEKEYIAMLPDIAQAKQIARSIFVPPKPEKDDTPLSKTN